jgi:hypothetical protein
MSIESKMAEVETLLRKQKERWKGMRLFLVTHNSWLRLYDDKNLERHYEAIEYVIIKRLQPRRGEILDIFAKLEFLTNQLMQAKLLGLFSSNMSLLDDVLEYVDFFSTIKLLQNWNILDTKTDGEIINIFNQLKQVRNGLAHKWKETEVNYRGIKITENMDQFRQDLEIVWKRLIALYMQEQDKKIDDLIDRLKSGN